MIQLLFNQAFPEISSSLNQIDRELQEILSRSSKFQLAIFEQHQSQEDLFPSKNIILYQQMSYETYFKTEIKYKIILVGDAGTGKTSIFWRYIKNQAPLDHLITTIDFRYKAIQVQDKQVKLCIWDTAGQEKFRSIVATYFKSCDGVVLVFDLGNEKSWESIKSTWYGMATKRAPNACFMLLGAKKDMEIRVNLEDVNKWAQQRKIYFVQTSAMTGENIEHAFFTFAALIDFSGSDKQNVMSSFATSHSSGRNRTETTKQCQDFYRQSKKQEVHKPPAMSFYLKKEKAAEKKEKCCN